MTRDWDLRADELSTAAIADGEPTAWFDRLYAEGAAGTVSMPWDRDEPQPLLREWAVARELRGDARTAVVVGCGLGADAEYLATLGFRTTAFDVAPTAVDVARQRHPGSSVDYRVADLLVLPPAWRGAFDLVVEIFTVQALPDPPRGDAIAAVASLVALGGTLLAVQFRHPDDTGPDGADPDGTETDGPPFPLTRDVMTRFAAGDLALVQLEALPGPRWRAEYHRP